MRHVRILLKWAAAIAICLIPVATALVGLEYYWKFFDLSTLSDNHGRWGEFGDFMGGIVNPSVGLVTTILLVATLFSQQKELREQRRQMAKQSFEQTFFAWLDAYRQSIRDMRAVIKKDGVSTELCGRQVIEYMVEWDRDNDTVLVEIERELSNARTLSQRRTARRRLLQLDVATWTSKGGHALESAMTPQRIAIQVLRYVDLQTHMPLSDRNRYIRLFRASLGEAELCFLFLSNCQSNYDSARGLYAKKKLLYFLSPLNQPLVEAMLRHRIHRFSENAFDADYLAHIRRK